MKRRARVKDGQAHDTHAGEYPVEVGASSRDIRQTAALQLSADFTDKVGE